MAKVDRKIAIPVSENAHLEFSVDEMQAAYEFYGDEYLNRLLVGIDTSNIVVIRKALELTLKNCDVSPDDILRRYPLREVAAWIVDAISIAIHGRKMTAA